MDKFFDVPQDKNDLALRCAIFNGLGTVIALVSLVSAAGVYFILQPFIKPLLWALLCGSGLFPVKQILSTKFNEWIDKAVAPSTSCSQILFSPITLVIELSEIVGNSVLKNVGKIFPLLSAILVGVLLYLYIPASIAGFLWLIKDVSFSLFRYILDFFQSTLLLFSVILGSLGALQLSWKPGTIISYFCFFSLLWIAITAWISNYFFVIRGPVFALLQGLLLFAWLRPKPGDDDTDLGVGDQEDEENKVSETQIKETSTNTPSTMYIKLLALVCFIVHAVNLPLFLYIILVLCLIFAIKKACIHFGVATWLNQKFDVALSKLSQRIALQKEILLPSPVQVISEVVSDIFRSSLKTLKTYCDSVASFSVILGLICIVTFSCLFLSLQAYRESIYFVQVGSSIVNKTVIHNPELSHLLPKEWDSTLELALNNAYIYVRKYLAELLKSTLEGKDISNSRKAELENNTLELWDRVYQAWVVPLQPTAGPHTGPIVTGEAVIHSYNTLIERLQKTPEVVGLISFSALGTILSENMSTLTTGLDSVWSLLKSNTTLLISIISTLFSFIFGSGMSIINFFINMVVFLCSLFYLLNTSRDMYKPVDFVTKLSPKYGNKLAIAMENATREVLAASVKLSIFYGMWTWLIHSLFHGSFVYMPAVFAAILGAVPILGTYWVCLPACLDLWLVQGNQILSLELLIAQFLPYLVVDSTIYKEIKGGHPYLTGLSVAGGMFWLGFEGAVIGPLGLCLLFVIIELTSASAKTSSA